MSQARFDTGQSLCWLPLGVYAASCSLGDSPLLIVDLPVTPDLYYRIDYASLVLRYLSATDIEIHAELTVTGSGYLYMPILTATLPANPPDEPIPLYTEQIGVQLSLPFYCEAETAFHLRMGSLNPLFLSNCTGVVAVSYAYTFGA